MRLRFFKKYLFGCQILVVTPGLFYCSTHPLVVVGGLSCSVTCGILVPRTGIKPMSPASEGGLLTIGPSDF